MTLKALGLFRPSEYQPYVLRLQFDGGKGKACAIQLDIGQDQTEVAKRLRELADQVEHLKA